MKIHNAEQCSDTWLKLRAGVVTASEADALVSPLGKIRDSKGVESYLSRKLAEKWLGGPLPDKVVMPLHVDFGKILESEALPTFEILTNLETSKVGFITTDDGFCGCSPDGLVGEKCGLELKSPNIETHVKYLLAGEPPSEYVLQVQFSMFVTGFSHWYFMSYRRNMPSLILKIERDEKLCDAIANAIDLFREKFDAGWSKLVELNDGKEPVRTPSVDEYLNEKGDDFDTIP